MDRVAGQYAIYGLDDVISNTEGRMQMRYNICYMNKMFGTLDNTTLNQFMPYGGSTLSGTLKG